MKIKWKNILALLMICSMVLGGIRVTANAEDIGNVTVGTACGKAGDTVEVEVNLVENPGIVSLYLAIGYDANVLQLNSVTNQGLLPDYQSGALTNNPVAVSWEDPVTTVDHVQTGTLVKVSFTILDNAKPGDTEITVGQYGNNTPYDVNLNDRTFEYHSGKVTIEAPTHEHVFGDWTVTQAADCTHKGQEERGCTVEGCTEKETRETDALGHDFGEWKQVVAASITAPGREERTCSRCNYVESKEIPQIIHGAEDHVYDGKEEILSPADCTQDGSKKIYCSFEGCSAFRIETIPATGHAYGEWVITKEAAIGVDGEKVRTCANCGHEDKQVIPAIIHEESDHTFDGKTEVVKEATCTEAGTSRTYCSFTGCTAYQDTEIPATGHTADEWKTITEATCTEAGLKEQYCTVCQKKIAEEVIPANGHQFGEWSVVTPAGMNTAGKEERVCSVCSYKEEREIPAIIHGESDHTFNGKTEIVKEADCTHEGTQRVYCSFEGCTAYQDTVIPAKGHTLGEWVTVKEATCTEAGTMENYCTVCKELAETRTIQAKGHTYSDWTVVKEATFKEDGLKERVCEVCGDKLQEVIPKLSDSHEHDFTGEQTVIIAPTCTTKGKVSIKCSNPECDAVLEKETPALGHSFGEWKVTKVATETEEGSRERVCSICGEKEVEKLPKLEKVAQKQTTDTAQNTNNNNQGVKTGDHSNVWIWFAITFAALAGIVIVVTMKRKRDIRR